MSLRNLRKRHGVNRGGERGDREAINREIRAAKVGGDDLLDALESVDRLARRLRERGLAGVADAQAALDHLRSLRHLLESQIRVQYDTPEEP